MKKLFVLLIILLFAIPVSALEVGDKMPDVSGIKIQINESHWFNPYNSRRGVYNIRAEHYGDPIFVMEAFLTCGEDKKGPFGIYSSGEGVLYLDIDMDGKIDEKIIGPTGIKIRDTAPECP